MQTYCSDFLGRSFKISCAIHVLLLALMGTTFSEMHKPEKNVDEYIFIDIEEPVAQVDEKSFIANHLEQVIQIPSLTQKSAAQEQKNLTQQQVTAQSSYHKEKQAVGSVNALTSGSAGYGQESNSNDADAGQEIAQGQADSVSATSEEINSGGYQTVNIAQLATQFASLVEAKKEYPYIALKRGETGRVGVLVRLNADGSLAAAEVMQSSGVKSLDAGAIKAVQKACPFIHGAKQVIEFMVPIYYELNG